MADKAIDKLRLGAGPKTVALADLSADDLVSAMSDEQKTAVAAALAPPKAEEPAKTEPEKEPEAMLGEKAGAPASSSPKADAADPAHPQFAHGFDASTARMAAVFASEHFAGREALAADMLGMDRATSAEKIVATLAKAPKGGGSDMLAGLKGNNPDLGAGAEAKGSDSSADAKASWDKTFAHLGWTKQPA